MPHAAKPPKPRVVLDTKVLVSAFTFPSGAAATLWDALGANRDVLISSPAIVKELATVLRHTFAWQEAARHQALRLTVRKAELVNPTSIAAAVPHDPDDNHSVACALAGRADLIVTGDEDLLRLKEYRGIPIVRTLDFVRTLSPAGWV
jgi:putative PIN family toxin of toxin-antitoxin system